MPAPYRFFDVRVTATERIGRSLARVTFGGDRLSGLASGGRDQRLKLFLPHPGQDEPVVPAEAGDDWFARWRTMDPQVRAVMRTYTVLDQRPGSGEFDIDFALHETGPATRWAAAARPGDRAIVLAPTGADNGGVDFRPPDDTDWVLLAGDESALPALAGILAWLPAGTPVQAWIEVPHQADIRDLPTAAEAETTWLVREPGRPGLLEAIRDAALPPGFPYAWIAGESGEVRGLRRHLVTERGFGRDTVTFTGYWRRGAAEEDLLAQALAPSARTRD